MAKIAFKSFQKTGNNKEKKVEKVVTITKEKLESFKRRNPTAIKPVAITSASNIKAIVKVGGQTFEIEGGSKTNAIAKTAISAQNNIYRIRRGVGKNAFKIVMQETSISVSEMAGIMHTSENEIELLKAGKKPDRNLTEKLVLLQQLYERGVEVFENRQDFLYWLNHPVTALGNKKPKSFFDTVSGINLVADEIERLAYGVYS